MKISIIMPCYNRSHDLFRVLKAYDRQSTREPFEVVAIDDASTDQTLDVLSSYRPRNFRLRYLHQDYNQGPAAARNRGIAESESPLILIVGDDILPDSDFVHGHIQAHKYFPEEQVAILGRVKWPEDMPINTLMRHIDGIGAEQFSYYYLKSGCQYDFRHFYTANISLKKIMLGTQKQWFDTEFVHAAFEDVELSYRLSKAGMKIIYLSSPLGWHYHYHTIWSFSTRQYKSGLMVDLLAKKHPGIAWYFKGQYRKIIQIAAKAVISPTQKSKSFWLEDETKRLLSYYEWYPNQYLDELYSVALGYFYYKGFIDAVFGESKSIEKIHHFHSYSVLAPAVKRYLINSKLEPRSSNIRIDHRLLEKLIE